NLATGLPYDRLGGLDGLYFHLWNTPWEQRSLPDTAWAPGAVQVVFVAARAVEVQAELAPAWFDQPGGGLRFRVQPPARGVRDLLQSGVLAPVVGREGQRGGRDASLEQRPGRGRPRAHTGGCGRTRANKRQPTQLPRRCGHDTSVGHI